MRFCRQPDVRNDRSYAADIFARLLARNRVLVDGAENDALRGGFDTFQGKLRTRVLSTRFEIDTVPDTPLPAILRRQIRPCQS